MGTAGRLCGSAGGGYGAGAASAGGRQCRAGGQQHQQRADERGGGALADLQAGQAGACTPRSCAGICSSRDRMKLAQASQPMAQTASSATLPVSWRVNRCCSASQPPGASAVLACHSSHGSPPTVTASASRARPGRAAAAPPCAANRLGDRGTGAGAGAGHGFSPSSGWVVPYSNVAVLETCGGRCGGRTRRGRCR